MPLETKDVDVHSFQIQIRQWTGKFTFMNLLYTFFHFDLNSEHGNTNRHRIMLQGVGSSSSCLERTTADPKCHYYCRRFNQ
jgi:hypothetical protein